ncbi:hypothetical protein [Cellulomonas dongxiuzhuiae]|uniref:Transposase n=1 Tax=Cellulomonas dongxiuzhuiae TaxID=2819979 RepID=A0ABX8GM11_9CELL|nr:hypothetical protein [Cellulomonas dongxiuzhuiae]MBO3095598.1 hypothetical protein [Cellulomonas dongxiuzhuiae]QWC16566.1 hypothetical protein KKR89_02535 [Cellulomonas dongxiuzhuiae]
MTSLDDVVDELYGGTLDDFVARRDAAVRAAKAAKDKELAGRIGSLRKPTVAAWAVNVLVRDDPSLADALRDLGEGMRDAERNLDGPALRELGKQRRALVSGLVARARRLAADGGQKLSTAAAQEVEHTLTAALADPTVADAVAAGTLTHGTEHVGFGAAPAVRDDRAALLPESGSNAAQSGAREEAPRGRAGGDGAVARLRVRDGAVEGSRRAARTSSGESTGTSTGATGAEARERERREKERERLRRRHEQAVAAREAAQADLDRARTRHEDTATAEQQAVAALEDAETTSAQAYAAEEELVRALADVRRRLADARAALPRVDETLVTARARAREHEKAVRAAARELERATKAAERARDQERRASDELP